MNLSTNRDISTVSHVKSNVSHVTCWPQPWTAMSCQKNLKCLKFHHQFFSSSFYQLIKFVLTFLKQFSVVVVVSLYIYLYICLSLCRSPPHAIFFEASDHMIRSRPLIGRPPPFDPPPPPPPLTKTKNVPQPQFFFGEKSCILSFFIYFFR